jgi:hypothetical protein
MPFFRTLVAEISALYIAVYSSNQRMIWRTAFKAIYKVTDYKPHNFIKNRKF